MRTQRRFKCGYLQVVAALSLIGGGCGEMAPLAVDPAAGKAEKIGACTLGRVSTADAFGNTSVYGYGLVIGNARDGNKASMVLTNLHVCFFPDIADLKESEYVVGQVYPAKSRSSSDATCRSIRIDGTRYSRDLSVAPVRADMDFVYEGLFDDGHSFNPQSFAWDFSIFRLTKNLASTVSNCKISTRAIKVGTKVFGMGGLAGKVTKVYTYSMFEFDGQKVKPGQSGSPLVDEDGHLIGMVAARYADCDPETKSCNIATGIGPEQLTFIKTHVALRQ